MENKKEKHPMTTGELFELLCSKLKESGVWTEKTDEFLDYALGSNRNVQILTPDFTIRNNLDYGDSEGIYLDLGITIYHGNEKPENRDLGTFKTLRRDDEAMREMASLLAELVIQIRQLDRDDFRWTGANVTGIKESGERFSYSYICPTMEMALKEKDKLLNRCPEVVVRDNRTRKEVVYKRKEENESI